jgi:hypothetical protein
MKSETAINIYDDLKLEDTKTLFTSLSSLYYANKFIAHDNTFNDLINSGCLDLVSNGDLKFELQELHSVYNSIYELENHMERGYE